MTHNEIGNQLDSFVDGELAPEVEEVIGSHLGTCDECQRAVARIRSLKAEAASLAKRIEPPRDLWVQIAGRLDRPRVLHRTVWSVRYALAAAAVALVVVSAAITAILVRGGPDADVGSPQAFTHLVAWGRTEAEYRRAVEELEEALEVSKGRLAPVTVDLIEKNRRIIEAAIEESRAALAADPGNREILNALALAYEKKLSMLQQVTRLSSAL